MIKCVLNNKQNAGLNHPTGRKRQGNMKIFGMNNRVLMSLLAIAAGSAASFTGAWADPGQFSLSSGSPSPIRQGAAADMLATPTVGQYENGPWALKLTVPDTAIPGTSPEIAHPAAAHSAAPGLVGSEAAAAYNFHPGEVPTFGVNLTSKVNLNIADKSSGPGSRLNDYAAQADAYQILDRFKALGSLGYRIPGSAAGINMNKVIYGSVGGAYQLNDRVSSGVDFRLSQSPNPLEQGQRQVSAYISRNLDDNFKARGYLLQDFSNGIPDRSIGAAVSYGF